MTAIELLQQLESLLEVSKIEEVSKAAYKAAKSHFAWQPWDAEKAYEIAEEAIKAAMKVNDPIAVQRWYHKIDELANIDWLTRQNCLFIPHQNTFGVQIDNAAAIHEDEIWEELNQSERDHFETAKSAYDEFYANQMR